MSSVRLPPVVIPFSGTPAPAHGDQDTQNPPQPAVNPIPTRPIRPAVNPIPTGVERPRIAINPLRLRQDGVFQEPQRSVGDLIEHFDGGVGKPHDWCGTVPGRSSQEPVVVPLTTDRIVGMGVLDDTSNVVRVNIGIGAGFDAEGGRIGLTIDGQDFVVDTVRGENAAQFVEQLKAQIEAAGYQVAKIPHRGIDSLLFDWVITRSAAE